jgi:hypothetical protein
VAEKAVDEAAVVDDTLVHQTNNGSIDRTHDPGTKSQLGVPVRCMLSTGPGVAALYEGASTSFSKELKRILTRKVRSGCPGST